MPSPPDQRPDVVFALIGDLRYNTRALKQLQALSELDCKVLALGIGSSRDEVAFSEHVRIHLFERPEGRGPSFFWKVHRMMKEAAASVPAKVYHASDLYTLPALAAASRQHEARLVYDARERYPYVAAASRRPWVSWTWEAIERSGIRKADAVFTVSESIASHIAASYNTALPHVLYNVPELQQVEQSSLLRNRLGIPSTQAIVLHQGKMQKDRGCLLLVKAIQKINRAALVFLGDGPLRPILEEEVRNAGLAGTVYFHDPVSPEHLLAHTASADIGVTLLEDTCLNHRFALPNKLFEYLMAGLPVLASDLLEIERVVTEWDVGKVVYPEDPDAVAGVLQAMLDAPDQLKRWAANTPRVFETFNWESASEDFKHVYRNLLDAGVE